MVVESSTVPAEGTPAKMRFNYLDWLRVFAMLSIFLYHNNRFFNAGDWHVKNTELSIASTIVENILGTFLMPLLFALSGAAIFYSLRSRSAGEFCRERFLRLMVPLLTLGIFIFGPLQIYLERITHGDFTGSFWEFIPHYFEGLYGFGGNFAWMGVHLWYLLILFIFSLLFLPLLAPLKKQRFSWLARQSTLFKSPWALFLLFIPLIFASHLTDVLGMGTTRQMGGWDTFSYMLFFLYGYLIVVDTDVIQVLRKYSLLTFIVAVTLGAVLLVVEHYILSSSDGGFSPGTEMRPLVAWLLILAIFGGRSRYFTANNKFLSYANEAVLPFYILHQPIILSIGYFVVQWNLPVAAKYFIIAIISFIIIIAIYEFLVRRIKVLRFLFGMKAKKKAQLY